MADRVGKLLYGNINHMLLRIRRTGTPSPKDLFGADMILSLDQLRENICPSFVKYRYADRKSESGEKPDDDDDDDDDDEEEKEERAIREALKILDAARSLPPEEERKMLLREFFERRRRELYEFMNEQRVSDGEQPWYILTREEVDSVGFILPYSLVTHPDHKYIKEEIRKEEGRLKECFAIRITPEPWSTWKE